MKSIAVLLSIIVVVFAETQNGASQELIANFSNKVVENFNKLIADVKTITSSAAGRAKDIIAGISAQVDWEAEKIHQKIKDTAGIEDSPNDCIVDVITATNQIEKDANEKIQGCGSEASKTIDSFQNGIVGSIEQLKLTLGKLTNLAKECKNDKNCVINKINESKKLFTDTIDKFEGVIEQAKENIENLIEGTRQCALSALKDVMDHQQGVPDQIKQCLSNDKLS